MSVDYNGYVIFHERQGNTTGANSLAPKTTLYSSRAASINHLPGSTDQISWHRRPKPTECRFSFKYLCAWIQTSLESLLGQGNGERWQNEQLEAEERMHGDLIRGAQKEHYRNLTLKTQMGLEWASKYCDFQFLVKADDDVFVHSYNLIDFLKKPQTPKTKLYMGRCPQRGVPKRGPGKYAVSWTEYNNTSYPPYCSGPAYVLSSDLVPKLLDLFNVKAPLPLEDVYIGTLVDKIGGVKAVTHPEFRTLQRGPCRYYPGIFAYHIIRNESCMFELFNFAKNAERGQTSQPPSVKIPEKNSAEHRKI
ncbi:beta-1,3-galactosyltransferase 4-like isoform X2 [Montipora foliosa]|uniref:beta-1,3-galactosyltransferase 4-like isoform X2 n=1 Tax=Montipora foliosa TaxID=591990 RepID=UPI0035F1D744